MYDIAIIGAGPAGASAALFAAKAGKKTLLVDNDKSITKRAMLWNYPGVMELTGPELVETGKQQAIKFGAEMVQGQVVDITKKEHGFVVETENKEQFEAKHVILATGLMVDLAEKLGIETKPGTEPRASTAISFARARDGRQLPRHRSSRTRLPTPPARSGVLAAHGARRARHVVAACRRRR